MGYNSAQRPNRCMQVRNNRKCFACSNATSPSFRINHTALNVWHDRKDDLLCPKVLVAKSASFRDPSEAAVFTATQNYSLIIHTALLQQQTMYFIRIFPYRPTNQSILKLWIEFKQTLYISVILLLLELHIFLGRVTMTFISRTVSLNDGHLCKSKVLPERFWSLIPVSTQMTEINELFLEYIIKFCKGKGSHWFALCVLNLRNI